MATGGTTTEAAPETLPPPSTQIFMPPSNLPPPKALVLDDNVATNWKAWKKVWSRYEIATGISKQDSLVRVSTFLSVIGEDATKAFDAFEWREAEDDTNIEHVLAKFDACCEPRTQFIYERYRFNNRTGARRKHRSVSHRAKNDRKKLPTRGDNPRGDFA